MRFARAVAVGAGLLGAALGVPAGCGARSGLKVWPKDAGIDARDADVIDVVAPPECTTDADCDSGDRCFPLACIDGECVDAEPIDCDDLDECTADECAPQSGECRHLAVTLDEDGDGFRGPRPGYPAGAPGSCGDDCDDTSARAYPGGFEECDGVDNDCNGVIDDDARYVPAGVGDVRVTSDAMLQGGSGGLVHNGALYGATYAGQTSHWTPYLEGLLADGTTAPELPETAIAAVASDSFTGPIVWTGAMFGTAWEDRRNDDYEIYFNRLDAEGHKLSADVRLSSAPGFSLRPQMIWNGSQFVLVWQDERDGGFRAFGQIVDAGGSPVGENVALTLPGWQAESPVIAEGETRLGLAFNMGGVGLGSRIGLRTLAHDFSDPSDLVLVDPDAGGGVGPSIVWNRDRYVVAWSTRDVVPGDSIWGAALGEDGSPLVPARRITTGATFARTQSLLALGDRLLLVWADDRDGNYELYAKMISPDLDELTPPERVTNDPSDTVFPIATFGAAGDVGVLFDDRRSGSWQAYFTRLVCVAGGG
jgi:hypothetical protein